MKPFRIGTRGSPLALVQAEGVQALLRRAHPGVETKIVILQTSGDWKPEHGETLLSADSGGKALFSKELEQALLQATIDIAVHSAKDMETTLPDGLCMDVFLRREDPRDCLITRKNLAVNSQYEGLTIGTSSARRAAFLQYKYPGLQITPLRGNVQTRLQKLEAGQVDATLLAMAGLNRLGLNVEGSPLAVEAFIPAAAQGAIGIEYRASDFSVRELLAPLHHKETGLCVMAERAVIKALNGTCRSPIGAHAVLEHDTLKLRAAIAGGKGEFYYEASTAGNVRDAADSVQLGLELGAELKKQAPAGF